MQDRLHTVTPDGQVCGLFAVDIVRFTGPQRDDDIQMYMHTSLYNMLETAFDKSGVPWSDCSHEDRGDGVLIVVPPTIPAASLIGPPERLRHLIRRHNRVSCDAARIQLRAAAHLGPVHHDGHGFIGADMNLLCRLLDARQLKERLIASGAEIGLITSDYLYVNIICRQPSLIEPTMFRAVNTRVKNTRIRAWAYVPDGQAHGQNMRPENSGATLARRPAVVLAATARGRGAAQGARRSATARPGREL